MALVQLNLKVPPEVAEDWRRRAADAGHRSVRDWILSVLSPTAESAPALAGRVEALEAEFAAMRDAVAQLQQAPAALVQAMPLARPVARPATPPGAPTAGPVPADGIETAALAERLGMRRHTFNAAVARRGGIRPGLELYGWRCMGTRPADRGGPRRAVWVPAGTADDAGDQLLIAADPVPAPPGTALDPLPTNPAAGTA